MNAHDLKNSFYLDIYFKGHYNKAALRYLEKNGLAPVIEDGDMDIIRAGESDFLALNYYNSEAAKACPADAVRSWAGWCSLARVMVLHKAPPLVPSSSVTSPRRISLWLSTWASTQPETDSPTCSPLQKMS